MIWADKLVIIENDLFRSYRVATSMRSGSPKDINEHICDIMATELDESSLPIDRFDFAIDLTKNLIISNPESERQPLALIIEEMKKTVSEEKEQW